MARRHCRKRLQFWVGGHVIALAPQVYCRRMTRPLASGEAYGDSPLEPALEGADDDRASKGCIPILVSPAVRARAG